MPTTTPVNFYFDSTADYNAWTIDAVTDVTVSHNTSTTDADGVSTNGQVQAVLTTRNRNRTGHIRILKSWENLGVPAGATVTHVQVLYSECQSANAQSSNSDSGPFELRNADNTVLNLTLLNALNRTATSTYARRDSGAVALSVPEASNVQHYFRLTHRLQTPNTVGANVTLLHDYITITVTYNLPPTGGKIKAFVGGSFVEKPMKVIVGGNPVTKNLKVLVGGSWVLS